MYAFTAKYGTFFTMKELHYNHCINQKTLVETNFSLYLSTSSQGKPYGSYSSDLK